MVRGDRAAIDDLSPDESSNPFFRPTFALQQGQSVVVSTLQAKFNSTASVNLDSEMSNLIQLQNAYAANAHVMSVVQSMMNTLLQAQV